MKLAVVLVRGPIMMRKSLVYTLQLLRLYSKNSCIVIDATPSVLGMLHKVKDFVTWGEITSDVCQELFVRRGRLPGNLVLDDAYLREKLGISLSEYVAAFHAGTKTIKDVPGLKGSFRLHPPRKGFERGGIKKQFSQGGVLGYRKDKINELLLRMI